MEEQKIEESLISFETAKLAKEKGFCELVCWYYYPDAFKINNNPRLIADGIDKDRNTTYYDGRSNGNILNLWKPNENKSGAFISAPTQSLIQKWLREVHNIDVRVANKYRYYHLVKDQQYFDRTTYDTYEQALEVGLLEGLKLIKINNE